MHISQRVKASLAIAAVLGWAASIIATSCIWDVKTCLTFTTSCGPEGECTYSTVSPSEKFCQTEGYDTGYDSCRQQQATGTQTNWECDNTNCTGSGAGCDLGGMYCHCSNPIKVWQGTGTYEQDQLQNFDCVS
jgi:hypothetical protein